MVRKLELLVKHYDSDLCIHFEETGLKFLWFTFKWMNCFLMREFSLSSVIRMWDTYFSEEKDGFEEFHVYVCAAILRKFSSKLKAMEFESLFEYIQVSLFHTFMSRHFKRKFLIRYFRCLNRICQRFNGVKLRLTCY